MDGNRRLSRKETAALIGISEASVANWERQGILASSSGRYCTAEVESLINDISCGRLDRLGGRANKLYAASAGVPLEYAGSTWLRQELERLTAVVSGLPLTVKAAVFLLAVNLFTASGDMAHGGQARLLDTRRAVFRRNNVKLLLEDFLAGFGSQEASAARSASEHLLGIKLPAAPDILGLAYQSLVSGGKKAVSGSFYTPEAVCTRIAAEAAELGRKKTGGAGRMADPCCGTGQFLLSYSRITGDPYSVEGFDTDELACFIASANLLLQFPETDFKPPIINTDSLLDSGLRKGGFDIVATNPPWGARYPAGTTAVLRERYPDIKSGESFSYFIRRCIELCNDGGLIYLILPESVTNTARHEDIRRILLEECSIRRITGRGRLFKSVYSPVVQIDLCKTVPMEDTATEISAGGGKFSIPQIVFKRAPDMIMDIGSSPEDRDIIGKVSGCSHTTLSGNAQWALGIVTGNNRLHLTPHDAESAEPVIRGSDIGRGFITEPSSFIRFRPEAFQQCAPERFYREPVKLVYRFISRSLVFAADTESRLTLNSANILIPQVEDYSPYLVMQLLNSELYNFVYMKRFAAVKVLRSNLEKLPLPLFGSRTASEAETCVQNPSGGGGLNELLYDFFGLSRKQRTTVSEFLNKRLDGSGKQC